jgi:hypothetical protein
MPEGSESESEHSSLKEAERELKTRLEEACAVTTPVSEESTAELIRLEEALSGAAEAAKETVSLRQQISGGTSRVDEVAREPGSSLREFTDSTGVTWRVWEVIPGQSRSATFTADFVAGWLCFERADGTVTRRLPHHPPGWRSYSAAQLERLLADARVAKRRGASGYQPDETDPPRSAGD